MRTDNMTFAEFQASGKDTNDLRDACPSNFDRQDYPDAMPGRHYAGENSLYIERAIDPSKGEWITEVGNFAVQGSLHTCEVELYAFYVSECTSDEKVRAALHEAAPASKYWPREADTEQSLIDEIEGYCTLNSLTHQSADDMLCNPDLTPGQREWLTAFIIRWDAVMDGAE